MKSDNTDMDEVVKHTKGLAEDNDIHGAEAAAQMAEQLDGVDAKDIISEL